MKKKNFALLAVLSLLIVTAFQNCGQGFSAPTEAVSMASAANANGVPTYSWIASTWSACSALCGNQGGTQSRTVTCQQDGGAVVSDFFCSTPKPAIAQICNQMACSDYMWIQGGFGACSTDCGGGTQTQSVTCVNNQGAIVAENLCGGVKPASTKSCNTMACQTPKVCTPGAQRSCTLSGGATGTQSCNSSGTDYGTCVTACLSTEETIRAALARGDDAVLCPNSTIPLQQSLSFTKSYQKLYTAGLPQDSSRAKLIISSPTLTTAIDLQPATKTTSVLESVEIKNIIVDGNSPVLGLSPKCPFSDSCHGLVNLAAVNNPLVDNTEIRHTRTWAQLVFTFNNGPCSGARATNNKIGPAVASLPRGSHQPENAGAGDGISVNCPNSVISNNQVVDVADAGIVVFAQPNVKVTGNTVTAISNRMNIGLSMTDYDTGSGNYEGTVFSGNTVVSKGDQGGFIYVGATLGDRIVYGDRYPAYNRSGSFINNTLIGPSIGTGIALSGADGITVTGNQLTNTNFAVDPTHVKNSNLQPGALVVPPGTIDGMVTRSFYISRMYEMYYGRKAPDSDGFTYWTTRLYPCDRAHAISVTQEFLANPQVAAYLNARTPEQALNALYIAINDAPPDAGGFAFWLQQLVQAPNNAAGLQTFVPRFYASSYYTGLAGDSCLIAYGN